MHYEYVGDGEHYYGVPARNLSAEEFAALTPEQQAAVASGRLYRAVSDDRSDVALPEPAAIGQADNEHEEAN